MTVVGRGNVPLSAVLGKDVGLVFQKVWSQLTHDLLLVIGCVTRHVVTGPSYQV